MYDETEVRSFEDMEFKIGFAVENYKDRRGIDDSRFVEWEVALVSNVDGVETK